MLKLIGLPVVAGLLTIGGSNMALAQSSELVAVERVREVYRVCRDSDGDRVPCGRVVRYYRDDEPSYRVRYYDPNVRVRFGPGRYYIEDWE